MKETKERVRKTIIFVLAVMLISIPLTACDSGDNGRYVVDVNGIDDSGVINAEIDISEVVSNDNQTYTDDSLLEYTQTERGIVITNCDESVENLEIPRKIKNLPVIGIGEGAFAFRNNPKSITLPDTLKFIEDVAFAGCNGLTSIIIPDSVEEIGEGAFSFCKNLTNVQLPRNLQLIQIDTFSSCENLKNIEIPNSVNRITTQAFYACNSLIDITIPGSVTWVGPFTFASCENLQHVTIMDGVEQIDGHTFDSCTNLTSVEIPNSIVDYKLAPSAFNKCPNLSTVYFTGSQEEWDKISGKFSNVEVVFK